MSIDLDRARAETPGCGRVAHFNNAGAALMPRPVLDAVADHLRREAEIGGYEAAEEAEPRLEAMYDSLARLLNCGRDEIAFVENATRAWDMAFYSFRFAPGDRILTGVAEYASNAIAMLHVAARSGARIEVVPDDAHGQIDTAALGRTIDSRVKLIALTHIPTNGGLINPAAEVGRQARAAGIPFLLDACQSVGQMPIDVRAIGCDMLSATGRKFLRGPRGTGFLYVRRELCRRLEPVFLDLHAASWTAPERFAVREDARRFENWESYVAGRLGLGAAVDYALGWGLEAIGQRVVALAETLRTRLAALPGVVVRDKGQKRSGIVTFTVAGHEPAAVKAALHVRGINVSTSSAASTRYDMDARGLAGLVRASAHYYNTEAEIDRLVAEIAALVIPS
ncbi:MAG: aminotransferase class V-fold PLP-dependent enzyme [Alphaproteobacteria bacterium]|nr:aminotransferase class V-fold PLP-dependent enzyme [Alphaproteobacteria bacterium]